MRTQTGVGANSKNWAALSSPFGQLILIIVRTFIIIYVTQSRITPTMEKSAASGG